MKLFAKRKKKTTSSEGTPTKESRSSFASDPVVEELLKKDPSEWNSKQRRMIKRYQDRKDELEVSSEKKEDENKEEEVIEKEETEDHEAAESDIDSSSTSDEEETPAEDETPAASEDLTTAEEADTKTEDIETTDTQSDNNVPPSHEIFKLLSQLNSKAKRTLCRKLERAGASVLAEVENEAKKLLGVSDEDGKKRMAGDMDDSNTGSNTAPSKKKRKKKNDVDLSKLPAKERLRREEQRQKQQEAAERRARGDDKTPGYKHPLNSERRRANRRKPKWKNGVSTQKSVKNEHHSSGYHHRKEPVPY